MVKLVQLLAKDELVHATPVGTPLLLDKRKGTYHRAGRQTFDTRADAFYPLAGVEGTTGIVVQPCILSKQVGKSVTMVPELSDYDASQLRR